MKIEMCSCGQTTDMFFFLIFKKCMSSSILVLRIQMMRVWCGLDCNYRYFWHKTKPLLKAILFYARQLLFNLFTHIHFNIMCWALLKIWDQHMLPWRYFDECLQHSVVDFTENFKTTIQWFDMHDKTCTVGVCAHRPCKYKLIYSVCVHHYNYHALRQPNQIQLNRINLTPQTIKLVQIQCMWIKYTQCHSSL